MESNNEHKSGGFRWIDLVVLLGVVAFGAVLSTGIVHGTSWERNGTGVCQNNVRQLSAAMLGYENRHGQYPGYANVLITNNGKPYVDSQTKVPSAVSYVVPLLPLLDRPDLYRAWGSAVRANGDAPVIARDAVSPKVRLDLLQCPSDPPTDRHSLSNSYVVNCGMKDCPASATMPRDWADNGIFFDHFTGDPRVTHDKAGFAMVSMSNAFIARKDGLQNTILMSENVDAGNWTDTDEARIGILWNAKGTIDKTKNPPHLAPPDENMQINHGIGMSELASNRFDPAVFARPSSYHPGGVFVAFCDGHVRFVSDKIDYYVYCLLMSPNGQGVREPCSNTPLPDFGVAFEDTWLEPNKAPASALWALVPLTLIAGFCLAWVLRYRRYFAERQWLTK